MPGGTLSVSLSDACSSMARARRRVDFQHTGDTGYVEKMLRKIMVFGSATSCVSYSGTMLTQKSWLSNLMHARVTKVRHLYLSQNYLPAFFGGSLVLIKYLRKRPWRMNSVCCITVYLHRDKRWRQLTTMGPHSGGREREMLVFNSLLFYSVQDPSPWDGAIHI